MLLADSHLNTAVCKDIMPTHLLWTQEKHPIDIFLCLVV